MSESVKSKLEIISSLTMKVIGYMLTHEYLPMTALRVPLVADEVTITPPIFIFWPKYTSFGHLRHTLISYNKQQKNDL